MGLVKAEWMEAQERGWSAPDTFVCSDCVEDSFLKELIDNDVCGNSCDYCGRSDVVDIAAQAEIVVQAVFDTVHAYYCEPTVGGVPYDHGFIVECIDIAEVLGNLGLDGHPDFVDAVIGAEANGDQKQGSECTFTRENGGQRIEARGRRTLAFETDMFPDPFLRSKKGVRFIYPTKSACLSA